MKMTEKLFTNEINDNRYLKDIENLFFGFSGKKNKNQHYQEWVDTKTGHFERNKTSIQLTHHVNVSPMFASDSAPCVSVWWAVIQSDGVHHQGRSSIRHQSRQHQVSSSQLNRFSSFTKLNKYLDSCFFLHYH